MDRRTTGIIATVAATLLCGFPGLCLCLFAAVTAAGVMPYTATFNDSTTTGTLPASYGYSGICLSLILIAIPFVVGFLMLRNRPAAVRTVSSPPDEPLPPAS